MSNKTRKSDTKYLFLKKLSGSTRGMAALQSLLSGYLHLWESGTTKEDICLRGDMVKDLACELGLRFSQIVLM